MNLKALLIFLLVVLVGYLYLSITYASFYKRIGSKNLQSPFKENAFTIGNNKKDGKATYVALGDSLSAGVGVDRKEDTIVYKFAEKLSGSYWQVHVKNYAWPGNETMDVFQSQLQKAVKDNPDYVTLFIGINDIHNKRSMDEFRILYKAILDKLLTETHAKIIVINLPYLGSNRAVPFPFNYALNIRTQQFNSIISSLAQNDRIKLIDLYNDTRKEFNKSDDNYAIDSFHPSAKGYQIWSQYINAD